MKIISRILFTGILLLGNKSYSENSNKKIKVLFTSAIIRDNAEQREKAYTRNLQLLKSYGCDVYVVESCQTGPTFLDRYCDHVCYTKSNDPKASKSANEALSMRIGLNQFQFAADDMIIKITGRYVLETNDFIRLVKRNLNHDVIIRLWNDGDSYTGLFAIKAGIFVDFLDNHFLNLISTTRFKNHAIEHGLANYIKLMKNDLKIKRWPKLYDYLPRCGPAEG